MSSMLITFKNLIANGAINPGLLKGSVQAICTLCEKDLSPFSRKRHYYVYTPEIGYFRVCKFCWNSHPGMKSFQHVPSVGSPDSKQEHKRKVSYYKRASARKHKSRRRSNLRRIAAKQHQKAPKPSKRRLP